MTRLVRNWKLALLAAGVLAAAPVLAAPGPAQLLQEYAQAAGAGPQPERGRTFFTSEHGSDWKCATCHGTPPVGTGRHATTGKAIAPLAPAFNPERFTDTAKTEKWFRRNCKDVVGRECTAAEKADILAWLVSLPAPAAR